jgi:hypothetical protein
MGLTLAYSFVKHGISLNPSVSKTSECHLGRFTLQLEQTQPVSCELQLVLQLAFGVCLVSKIGGSIQPTTKQKHPNFRSNDCAVREYRLPFGGQS